MIVPDITADLNDEDETGLVWTFLDEARDPSIVVPGAIVVAGSADAPAVAEVVDLVDKPAGRVVHLRLLPGRVADYIAIIRRAFVSTTPETPSAPHGSLGVLLHLHASIAAS